MSAHNSRAIQSRLPETLATALEGRAAALGRTVSAVVRNAVAREVAAPIDPRSVDFAAAWLNGEFDAESNMASSEAESGR